MSEPSDPPKPATTKIPSLSKSEALGLAGEIFGAGAILVHTKHPRRALRFGVGVRTNPPPGETEGRELVMRGGSWSEAFEKWFVFLDELEKDEEKKKTFGEFLGGKDCDAPIGPVDPSKMLSLPTPREQKN